MENIIELIKNNSLTVRCLPYVVVSLLYYREGDENTINNVLRLSDGSILNVKRSIVFSEKYKRKMIREERIVEKGGWWYVKETKNTNSNVIFNRRHDTFFAPTLEEAINLYLKSSK